MEGRSLNCNAVESKRPLPNLRNSPEVNEANHELHHTGQPASKLGFEPRILRKEEKAQLKRKLVLKFSVCLAVPTSRYATRSTAVLA
jgi:diaminopimelate decarboxylase